jgi:hypothetical protein
MGSDLTLEKYTSSRRLTRGSPTTSRHPHVILLKVIPQSGKRGTVLLDDTHDALAGE